MPHSASVIISPTASVTNVQPMGLNIGAWEYWQSSAAMLQNILMNPGFERSEDGRVVIVPSSGFSSTHFCDYHNYWNEAAGFYNGATFQDVYVTGSGATATASTRGTGTITGYDPSGGGVCTSGVPLFTYNASFTIQTGDTVMFHKTFNGSASQPAGWNNEGDTRWTLVADHQPNGDGAQALDLPLNGATHNIYQFSDATSSYTNPSGGSQNFVLINGAWTVSLWAKCVSCSADASVTVKFLRIGGSTFVNQTFTPTSSWAQYTFTFSGNETSLTANVGDIELGIAGNGTSGDIRFDDAFAGPASAATPPWNDVLVSMLQTLHPGVIREWQTDVADSYANMIADDAARGLTNSYGGLSSVGQWPYSLDAFLALAHTLGAIPWVNVPMPLSDSELSSLGSYLAAKQSTYNFPTILLEIGDEEWNWTTTNGVEYSPYGDQYTAINGRSFGIIKAAAGAGVPIKTIASGQQNNLGNLSSVAGTAANQGINYVDMATYYYPCDDTGKTTAQYLADMLNDSYLSLSGMQNNISQLNGLPALAYEGGTSTTGGSATNAERNGMIAGAASATSEAEMMLNWWTAGGLYDTTFQLSQDSFTPSGTNGCSGSPPAGAQAYLWGITHDFYTPLIRPRALAMQLLNRHFIINKTGNFHPAKVTGYKGVVVGAWEDLPHGYGWNVAAVNTTPRTQSVVVRFPSESRLPSGEVWQINHKYAINDENEECENAKGPCTPDVTIGQGAPITPGTDLNAITLALPPYGLIVGQATLTASNKTPSVQASRFVRKPGTPAPSTVRRQ